MHKDNNKLFMYALHCAKKADYCDDGVWVAAEVHFVVWEAKKVVISFPGSNGLRNVQLHNLALPGTHTK